MAVFGAFGFGCCEGGGGEEQEEEGEESLERWHDCGSLDRTGRWEEDG